MAFLTSEAHALEARRHRAATARAVAKRLFDVTAAAVALLALSPLLIAIYAILAPGGSPIFRQRRVGRDGVRFECLKFRTMRIDAEAALADVLAARGGAAWRRSQKLAADPRVTPLGGRLRRWGLDELPQLINVLRGEMSLVGPRPVIPPETPGYPADAAYAKSRAFAHYMKMRPGITGLWQVQGGADTPHRRRVELDQVYVRRWNLALDAKIILATPRALVRRKTS